MQVPQTEIIVTKDGVELARRVVTPGEYVFGRGEDVDFHMDTTLASRHHAKLYVNYDEWLIEDLASANGTFINDQPVPPNEATRVFPTQTLRVGDATVTLRRVRGSEAPDVSLAPVVAVGRTLLPEEVRARRYAIGKVVAQGGMGAILSAQDQAIRRSVAMKVMLQSGDAGDLTRFVEEAQITGQLEHPNIVPVHELGVDEQDQFFYTMKFVRGVTLRKVLELISSEEATAKKYPLGALLTIFQKVCDAIAFAHSRGVIHRDLKPENIMLGDFGEVLVMDWGLAKKLGERRGETGNLKPEGAAADATSGFKSQPSGFQTMAGSIMGTPQYMAPEQARGEVETMDQRADIYALGAILYHILALRPSVTGGDAMAIVEKVARGEVDPLGGRTSSRAESSPANRPTARGDARPPAREIPDSLAAVCRKAMALDPAARYQSVPALQAEIEAFQNGFATSAEEAGPWKQFTLFVRRNKAASIGVAAVLLIGGTLGTKAFVEGRRAARALADLKESAPAMLALAGSEAVAQHFESALEKTDAALRLDPGLLPAYWRRAWGLVALGRFSDAATALRAASERDPAHARQFGGILPRIEMIAAIPDEAGRYAPDLLMPVFEFLETHDARGEAGALIEHLRLTNDRRFTIAKERLKTLVGSVAGLTQLPSGLIQLSIFTSKLSSLEQVRGIPCDILNAGGTHIESLELLRGLHLSKLNLDGNRVTDLAPLRGMALVDLNLYANTGFSDLSPLVGMPLQKLSLSGCRGVVDVSPLHGMPLDDLDLNGTKVSDLGPLAGMPLRRLTVGAPRDLRPLAGMPLEWLSLPDSNTVADLSPLAGLPLKDLFIRSAKYKDLTPLLRIPTLERLATAVPPAVLAPLRQHPKLAFINYQEKGYRPVAEVWAELDAQQAAGKK